MECTVSYGQVAKQANYKTVQVTYNGTDAEMLGEIQEWVMFEISRCYPDKENWRVRPRICQVRECKVPKLRVKEK